MVHLNLFLEKMDEHIMSQNKVIYLSIIKFVK